MFNLRTIAFKLFRAASIHVVTCMSIITISICLIMTMSLYIYNAKAQMEDEIQALFGNADITAGYNPEQHQWLSEYQIEQIKALHGVESVSPISLTHTDVESTLDTVYTLGVENDSLVRSKYDFQSSLQLQDVILSESLAQFFDKQVGESIQINGDMFSIKEILPTMKGVESIYLALLSNDVVKLWMQNDPNNAGLFTLIETKEDFNPTLIAMDLKALDASLRVDITNEYDFVKRNLQSLMIFIIVLSVFVLLITGVLLLSTFQLLFYKIKEQLMILRALGATSKQVGHLVLVQLTVINSIGVMLGTCLSLLVVKYGLAQLIDTLGFPKGRLDFPFLLAMIIAGASFTILQLFAFVQVRKSMNLLPMQLASDKEMLTFRWTKRQTILSILMAGIALVCFISAHVQENGHGQKALLIVIGTLFSCSFLLIVMPFIFTGLLHICLQPIRTIFGKEAYLACQQLIPQVRKNIPIILSIIALMTILTFGSSLLKTVQKNDTSFIEQSFETSIVLKNVLNDISFTQETVEEIENLSSVSYAYATSFHRFEMQLEKKWDSINYATIDVEQYVALKKIASYEGDLSNGLVISQTFANKHGLKVGDKLPLAVYDFSTRKSNPAGEFPIIAITPTFLRNIDVYLDWSMHVPGKETPPIYEIMVETADVDTALAQLSYLQKEWPELQITNKETLIAESSEMFYQRWSLFVGVFVILIGATCLGVLQTLLHSIYVKRSDYAIQRFLGLSPNGLMKLILTQVLSFILYGLAMGTLIGLVLTKMLALVDREAGVFIDFLTLGSVSLLFLLLTMIVFSLQGYWISRRKLANEMI
ncbi:ABC transporter permease [Psychrobacillus sp.]|uniref:ABC transporter permease n=1 Tax=Psychrobacillus sp. TaxID=1871623 RepID=UPI0028BEE88E|nr:ABC transporter permease [Psychrobacillus sp.]